jgi:hypothetical protein
MLFWNINLIDMWHSFTINFRCIFTQLKYLAIYLPN